MRFEINYCGSDFKPIELCLVRLGRLSDSINASLFVLIPDEQQESSDAHGASVSHTIFHKSIRKQVTCLPLFNTDRLLDPARYDRKAPGHLTQRYDEVCFSGLPLEENWGGKFS